MVRENAIRANMPFVTERWLGGMLTNFSTIRKSVKKMQSIDKMIAEDSITKKERLMLTREKQKMDRVLGGIANLNRPPVAIFIVDISFEHIALAEARKLGLKTFGMVDTNSDPTFVDFPIPANDDASKSIELICNYMTECVVEGLAEREASQKSGGEQTNREFGTTGSGDRKPRRTRSRKGKDTAEVTKTVVASEEAPKAEAPKEEAPKVLSLIHI